MKAPTHVGHEREQQQRSRGDQAGDDDEDLAPAEPVGPDAPHDGGEHRAQSVRRRQQQHAVLGLVVGEVDRVLEVVEEVEDHQRVAEVHQEAGDPRPREVRVLPRRDPERPHEPAEVEGLAVLRRERKVAAVEDVGQREYDESAGRGQVAGGDAARRVGDARTRDDADGLRDREPTTDRTALSAGHLVGHGRGDRREHRVQGPLCQRPAERQHQDRAGLRQHQHGDHAAGEAAEHPRKSPSDPQHGPVARTHPTPG